MILYPGKQEIEYPTILESDMICLKGYSRESTIAEKVDALVKRDLLTSRSKDFFDIWLLSKNFKFKGRLFTEAIKATFKQRGRAFPKSISILLKNIAQDEQQKIRWVNYMKNIKQENIPDLNIIMEDIDIFLKPVFEAISLKQSFNENWFAGKGWK